MLNDVILYKRVSDIVDGQLDLTECRSVDTNNIGVPVTGMSLVKLPVYNCDSCKRTRAKFVKLIRENGSEYYVKMSDLKKNPILYTSSIIYSRLHDVDVTDSIISNPDEASLTAFIGPLSFEVANTVSDMPFTEDEMAIFEEIGLFLIGALLFRRNAFSGYDWLELELRPIRIKEYEKHKREFDTIYYRQSKRALMYYILNACPDVTVSDLAKFIVDHRS